MFCTRSLALLVVFGCVFAILDTACWVSVFGFGGSNREPAPLTLSAQANVSFARMKRKLAEAGPHTCDAGCYTKGVFDTCVRCRTGTQQ